jgi:predicted LPLAT superfamily acyltransferase
MTFGSAVLDKIAAWSGRLTYSALDGAETGVFAKLKASGKGVVLLTAHIGNPEVIRAIASRSGKVRVHVLMHTKHSELFNGLIRQLSPNSLAQVVAVTDVGPAEAMFFADAVARGEWVVIAADRIPVQLEGRTVNASFLGEDAPFPQGPFILGALLRVPVFFLFCVRDRGRFRIQLTLCADPILLPRHHRLESIAKYATQFANALEACVAYDPLQWFNFYPFWNPRRMPIAQQKVAE